MAVKRLTKDYYSSVFDFFKENQVEVVSEDQYQFWIKNLEDLNKTNKSYFYNKYEFFVNGSFSDIKPVVKPFCAAILKRCLNYTAEVKSIIVEKVHSAEAQEAQKKLNQLTNIIEIYCAESGIRILDYYTNTINNTSSYFLNQDKSYYLLFKREIDSKRNYEYVFRRNILINYFGDTTNWRDMCIWFLESIYLPLPSQKDSPTQIRIGNSFQTSFLNLPEFQNGFFNPNDSLKIEFTLSNNYLPSGRYEKTQVYFSAFIFGCEFGKNKIEKIIKKEKEGDIIIVFTLKNMNFSNSRIRNVTWDDITAQISNIHQHYYEL